MKSFRVTDDLISIVVQAEDEVSAIVVASQAFYGGLRSGVTVTQVVKPLRAASFTQ